MATDQTAVVTGAASGIGRAVTQMLADGGVRVVAVDRDKRSLDLLSRAEIFPCDVTSAADRAALVHSLGHVDYLVNAAGVIRAAPISAVTEDQWDEIMGVNAKAVFFMTQALRPRLAAGSTIVNIASTSGKLARTVENAVYNASKAAVIALTRTFAHAYAPDGIRVNCVCPGITNTPMLASVMSDVASHHNTDTAAEWAAYEKTIPLGRTGEPEEVAALIVFLLSNSASYMTGQAVNVCGGLVMD